jgi:hypothetical protein
VKSDGTNVVGVSSFSESLVLLQVFNFWLCFYSL